VTFLPQFVSPGQALLHVLLLLGSIFAVIGFTWMNSTASFVTRVRDFINCPTRAAVDGASHQVWCCSALEHAWPPNGSSAARIYSEGNSKLMS